MTDLNLFTTETAGLPEVLGPDVTRPADGDRLDLRIGPVRKNIGEVVRLYVVNTANTRIFNFAIRGARAKLAAARTVGPLAAAPGQMARRSCPLPASGLSCSFSKSRSWWACAKAEYWNHISATTLSVKLS
jgi:hypothetical protein